MVMMRFMRSLLQLFKLKFIKMKKILFALILLSSIASAQNTRPLGSVGSITVIPTDSKPIYDGHPTVYRDTQLIDFKTLKDTSAALRLLYGGGGSGTISGQVNRYGLFSSSTTIGPGKIHDTLNSTFVHGKQVYFNISGNVNQPWFYAVQDETGHTTYIQGLNPYTGNGWRLMHDSTTNQNRIVAYGTNSDFYFQSMRNVTFSNTGTTTMVTSLVVAGISSSALITTSLTGGNGLSVISTAANSYAGQEWKNQGNEITEIRVTGSTYGSYPSRTSIWFAGALNGQTTFLYGASALNKLYIGGLNLTTDLQRTDGVGFTMYKAGTIINWGTTSGSSGIGIDESSGNIRVKHSGSSFYNIVDAGTAQTIAGVKTFSANAIFNGTGSSITASGGTSGIVASGTNFGGEFTSVSTALLVSTTSTANDARSTIFQRSAAYTGAADDELQLGFSLRNAAGTSKEVALFSTVMATATAGAENGSFRILLMRAGASPVKTTEFFASGATGIFNGTAPSASVTDGVLLYSEDVAASAELKVRDEAGNSTTISPHAFTLTTASDPMAWSFHSINSNIGYEINVDMFKLARLVEQLSGEKLIYKKNLKTGKLE